MKHFKSSLLLTYLFILFFILVIKSNTYAGPGDTTLVQTFVNGSKQDSVFKFPDSTKTWEKVLMYYKLKCNPAQSPACGEWDYLTYTNLYEHTKKMDSTKYMFPNFKIGNSTPDSIALKNTPTFNYSVGFQYSNQSLMTDSALVGIGNYSKGFPLSSESKDSRTQFIVLASELTNGGLAGGNLSAVRLFLNGNQNLKNLKIRIKNTNLSFLGLSNFIDTGFVLVIDKNFNFTGSGWKTINFAYPFLWNGTSNLLIDISYSNNLNANNLLVKCDSMNFLASMISNQKDAFLTFDGQDYANISSTSFSSLDSFVTIGVWMYGDSAMLPSNSTLFEARNASGTRVLNIHFPWSNSNVYFDAGASGTAYDRINKVMTSQEYEGGWNYWTFTKNVSTGSMKIYKNGVLWHSGTSMTKRMNGITKFVLGGSIGNPTPTNFFKGNMDELSIWNVELSQIEIQQVMSNSISTSHPKISNLLCYYQFDEDSGITVADKSLHSNNIIFSGLPQWNTYSKTGRIKNIEQSHFRPQLILEQGNYLASNLDSILVVDSTLTPLLEIVLFEDTVHPNTNKPTDTIYRYQNKNILLFNSLGVVYDSIIVNPDLVLKKQMHPYWGSPFEIVNKYELGRFITPYGNGLDLGNGFTWVYDVTEFSKLLKDSVHLTAGNWQELLDMKFLMIEGTPARNILKQRIIYSGNYAYASPAVENSLIAKKFSIGPNTKMMNMSITTTGHGMGGNDNCAEFCPKTHKVKVNDLLAFSQYLFRENCDFNPLFPQGGTWIFPRANWCPGADVTKDHFELTPFVNNDSIKIDYDLETYTWNGAGSQPNYVITSYLFDYGDANFTTNVSIEDVIAPNSMKLYGRYNPICGEPIIVIKNDGKDTLTSLDIDYFVEGGQTQTFHWTGKIAFLAKQEITLPAINWNGWNGDKRFTVILKNPNGKTDEYNYNNRLRVNFNVPPEFPSTFAFYLKTNSVGYETSWEIRNASDSIIISKSNFQNDIQYVDTITLPTGCYTLKIKDAGGDGLKFWYNMPPNGTQTAGLARFRKMNNVFFNTLESDFGREISQTFTVGFLLKTDETIKPKNSINLYPNPANNSINFSFGLVNEQDVKIRMYDLNSKLVHEETLKNVLFENHTIQIENWKSGIYIVNIVLNDEVKTMKLIKN